ncbi:RNA-binding protein cabeza-like isoform X3 [Athalia rosae]|uniref:RNA-binding protein cabeza-like isoform X3 n=1 Tax=Athalia rosae TaxID=37344 RepID=UPI002033724C|nr:RNA-binding protein cabeza-like isoform X3 [Athalia rosae]
MGSIASPHLQERKILRILPHRVAVAIITINIVSHRQATIVTETTPATTKLVEQITPLLLVREVMDIIIMGVETPGQVVPIIIALAIIRAAGVQVEVVEAAAVTAEVEAEEDMEEEAKGEEEEEEEEVAAAAEVEVEETVVDLAEIVEDTVTAQAEVEDIRGYGDRSGGGGEGMVIQEDTIFVSGMDPSVTEDEICEHFGAIGIIKNDKRTGKPKIWMYKDKNTGKPKGEATVTYEDQNAARSAINWFDDKEFKGFTIKVQIAQHKSNWQGGRGGGGSGGGGGRGGGRGRGGFGGRGGGGDRDDHSRGGGDDRRDGGGRGGDWRCPNPDCGNTNFAWRDQCNLCKSSKPEGAGGGGRGGGDRGGRGGGFRGGDRGGRGGDRGGRGGGFRGDRGGGRGGGRGGPMRGGGGRGDRDRDRQRPY